jgi:polysaccharide export outer membrane protein
LVGCAETLNDTGFQQLGNDFVRAVPWEEGVEPTPAVAVELVSVDSFPGGEVDPVYRLGPGDRVSVNVFGEPGLENLIVQVDGAGDVQLPMLERLAVGDLSLGELQDLLKQGYAKHFVDPWIVVQLVEPLSRPVYLLGEFNSAGVVQMTQPTNVIQALGAGRGLTDKAFIRGARLIRDDRIVAVDIHALLNRGRMDQNVWLAPHDTIFVPGLDDLRIYVLGAVAQPGAKEITNSAPTLTEAISRSGGHRRGQANLEEVRIIRSLSPVAGELYIVDFTRIVRGLALDMPLQPGDIVYVPVNGMGGWNEIIEAISPTILTISRALDPFVLAKTLDD